MAYRRMRAELAGVDLVAELENGDDDETPAAGGAVLGADWIAGLDARRQDEPEAVAAELATGLDQVAAALLPQALGAWSSSACLMLELETAAYLNRWALRLAEAAGDSPTVAGLYLRRSYIVADAGDHARALTLTELAAGIFARLGDQAGEGRALVDCGRWLLYLGRRPESIAAHTRVLDLLPESEGHYRIAARQTLGLVYLDLGNLDMAERCADLGAPLLQLAVGPQDRGKFLWFRASICRRRGKLEESEKYLREVVEIFRKLHHGEAALSAVDLAEVLFEQKKPGEARQVCHSMWPLLAPLERNPVISAAFGELLRESAHGSLSLDLMKRIRARIEGEQVRKDAKARQRWRALAVRA